MLRPRNLKTFYWSLRTFMMSIENFEDVHILLTKSLMFYIFQGALGKIENKVEDILNRLDYLFR